MPALPQAEASDILAKNPITVIHFWAIWDYHDRRLDQILKEVCPEFEDSIVFYSVDVDDETNHDLCRRVNLLNIPALACFLQGSWHETRIGVRSAEEHREQLRLWQTAAQNR